MQNEIHKVVVSAIALLGIESDDAVYNDVTQITSNMVRGSVLPSAEDVAAVYRSGGNGSDASVPEGLHPYTEELSNQPLTSAVTADEIDEDPSDDDDSDDEPEDDDSDPEDA